MSGQMMLSWLANKKKDEYGIKAAEDIERAVYEVVVEGKVVTKDLGGSSGTKEMGQEICRKLLAR